MLSGACEFTFFVQTHHRADQQLQRFEDPSRLIVNDLSSVSCSVSLQEYLGTDLFLFPQVIQIRDGVYKHHFRPFESRGILDHASDLYPV